MLELQKRLARDHVTEQQRIMDTILNGAEKAAKIVTNIRKVKDGEELLDIKPLLEKKEMFRRKAPEPPVFESVKEVTLKHPIEDILDQFTDVRVMLSNVRKSVSSSSGIIDVEKRLYDINKAIHEYYTDNIVL